MSLSLEAVTRRVGRETHIDRVDLTFEPGSFNVLLGRTLSGKTSLMRLMAGLDVPSDGRIVMNGEDVTGRPVRERNISMVYQQFINYPSLSVYDNIASPLKLARMAPEEIRRRVHEIAEMLHIEQFLARQPAELSGGQQQRTAMARALVKDADLVLFDEPLVNLDYKLREELRHEMRSLFATRNTIAVYATTEPGEALALGGTTTLMHEGRVLQSGPTEAVYHHPVSVEAAKLYSEPQINLFEAEVRGRELAFSGAASAGEQGSRFVLPTPLVGLESGAYRFGIRPSHLGLAPLADDDLEFAVTVDIAEISGSETFLHVSNADHSLVLHLSGIHDFAVDDAIRVYAPAHKLFVFADDKGRAGGEVAGPGGDGALIRSPERPTTAAGGLA
ncbi:ABC transporter ATP-binding protein [Cobetia marina]|uniref:ABC transporter ATP-binding protein n=1 Tax=Cobetia marina TaxID=28258 RepID=UPI00174E65DD|nr:ABC transporter ATP-binding protein [Cobetia pacifica]MDI6002211.1 ABC transporter ATP-binding protein [Cobetia pacifica]